MNRLTLRQRLLLLTLLPSALIAIVLVAYFTYSGIRTLEGELRRQGVSTARYLAPIAEYGIIAGQSEALHALAQAAVQEPGVKATIIVNQKGKTMAVSGRVSLSAEDLRRMLDDARQVAETNDWIAFGAPVRRSMPDTDQLFEGNGPPSAAPEVVGQVFIEYDKLSLIVRQRELLYRGLGIVLFGLLMIAMLAVAMADNLAQPVMRLVEAVRGMSSGRLDTRVPANSRGELGILESGFNDMAQRIEEVHQSMQSRIEEATALLAFQASHDPLTGLFNRREFEHRLAKALDNTKGGGDEFSVLFLDLDRFKQVNDVCGHLAGDELLRQIALLIQGRLREEDTLARIGGDEFAIILANCNTQRARQVAEDICTLTAAYRFIWQEQIFSIGASIGLTPVNRQVRTAAEIIAAADKACQRAKESGRNHVCEQEALNTPERRSETGAWFRRIASALAENRVTVEAIPLRALQLDDKNGHVVELTARLHEPGQSPIALPALIDAAERYDLGPAIDLHLIEVAMAALIRAANQQKHLQCLVPISRTSLGRQEVIEYIETNMAQHDLSRQELCLIFSEDASTHHTSQAIEFARQLRALGCRVGLDDFGSGLTSFNHLRSIGPAYIKLSQSLTRDLDGNRASTALLRAIQEIATDQHIRSVADGVNTPEALEQLRSLGIDYAEGKAVSPCEPFDVWLEGAVMRAH